MTRDEGLLPPVAAGPKIALASTQGLDCPVVDCPECNERGFMMNHTDGWMGGGMWIWTVIGVLVVVLLVVVINNQPKN